MATAFNDFVASFGRDGPDYSLVVKTTGGVRAGLERDLLEHLATRGCEWTARALGLLRSSAAIPELRARLASGEADSRPYYARALWDIEALPDDLAVITSAIVDQSISALSRTRIIWLLADIRRPEAFAGLEAALHDPDSMIRYNAAAAFSNNSARPTADDVLLKQTEDYDAVEMQRFIHGTLRHRMYGGSNEQGQAKRRRHGGR